PILFPIDRRHHIRDGRSVGREMWIRERFERQIVVGGDAANLRESRRRRRGEHECKNSQLFHARALFFGVILEIFRSSSSNSRPYNATLPMPAFPFIPSRITANASFATGPSGAR